MKKTEIKVFNKVDAVEDKSKIEYIRNNYDGSVIISAAKGINISKLVQTIKQRIESVYVEEEIFIPLHETKIASQIHDLAEVYSTNYSDDAVKFRFRTSRENADRINKLLQKVNH